MNSLCSVNTHGFHKKNTSSNLFPATNLLYNFSALSGTGTTTNGATIANWTDARTGLVGTGSGSNCVYRTDVTINSHPTVAGYVSTTLGSGSLIQNYWTWYCVVRTGGTALSGDNNLTLGPQNPGSCLEIGLNGGKLNPCYAYVAWAQAAASVSGGTSGSWIAAINTNYILTIICSGTNNTTTAAISYIFRINGVDYTPSNPTDNNRYYYISNPLIGNSNSPTQTYMGEQTLYNTAQTLATAQTMEQYLSYKWGIGIGATPTVATSSPYSN